MVCEDKFWRNLSQRRGSFRSMRRMRLKKQAPSIQLARRSYPGVSSHLTARIEDEGLVIEGQDLGPGVSAVWGDSDYEYFLRVQRTHFYELANRLAAKLGAEPPKGGRKDEKQLLQLLKDLRGTKASSNRTSISGSGSTQSTFRPSSRVTSDACLLPAVRLRPNRRPRTPQTTAAGSQSALLATTGMSRMSGRQRPGSRLGPEATVSETELGVWDKLLECVQSDGSGHSYGEVEDRFFELYPLEASALQERYGHRWRDGKKSVNQFSMSVYLAARPVGISRRGCAGEDFWPRRATVGLQRNHQPLGAVLVSLCVSPARRFGTLPRSPSRVRRLSARARGRPSPLSQ